MIPYLHFRGQAAEALAFYAEVFGGTDLQTLRYGEAPNMSPDRTESDGIMHGQITTPGGPLMVSDFPPGVNGDPQAAVSIMHVLPDIAAATAAFERLGEGGEVIDAFKETFFSPGFGMVRDRFGTHWIISVAPQT